MAIFQNTSGQPFYHPVTNQLIKPEQSYEGAAHMEHEADQYVPEEDKITEDDQSEEKSLADMDPNELKEYAEKNHIDIGKSTSRDGIFAKIKEAESGDVE